ncbi:MAG: hypothetical protein KGI27_09920 [Thaumarchaeota archaeon]|nr:hypothetical protein [Nitrososphaerota archaeon]
MADYRWALFRAGAYLRGRGVTFGSPLVPQEAVNSKIYSICVGLVKGNGVVGLDENFDIFSYRSLDHVLVTPMVAACKDTQQVVKDLISKLKVGGHFVTLTDDYARGPGTLDLPSYQLEQWIGESGRWQRKLVHGQDGKTLMIFKRLEGKKGVIQWTAPQGRRVLVCRYGALGDAIVMTPLLRKLKEDGWHVSLNVNPYCLAALENNPYVDNLIVQEKDVIPNPLLGEYWKFWAGQYDKYINLSESIEGDLLMVEGRPCFYTPQAWRHSVANVNYYDYTMSRGGYPKILGTRGELFFTNAEERKAKDYFRTLTGKFVVVWALNGSSHHKVYPMMEPTLRTWFKSHPDSVVITTGDTMAQLLEFPHPQMIPQAGKWGIRESLISTKYADLVIGPETMMTNAAGCFPTPKMVFLSHSSPENLTKYWENCVALEPTEAPCWPCHQLHYTKESCPIGVMRDTITGEELGQAPMCSMGVSPTKVLEEMEKIYQAWKGTRKVLAA